MPSAADDEFYMRRAILLAMKGRGRVEPNPMVGSVIVKDGRVIGEGYHAQFGGPHAEPAALENCRESIAGATVYVTLEPCCHLHKKTPPCAPRLIQAGLSRVVIGCLDPNPQVDGGGAAMLRAAGIGVDARVLETECQQLIAPFIARVRHHRPYVTAKWAQSANGQVAGPMGRPARITNATSDRCVHELRARCDAIAVGTNTVLSDNPLLTARGIDPIHRRLLRVVLSNSLNIPITSRIVTSSRQHPVVIYTSETGMNAQSAHARKLADAGVEVVTLPTRDTSRFSFADVLADLHVRDVTHLLIEPGPTLCRYLLSRGQVDRVWVFQSPREIENAGALAISAAPRVDYPVAGRADLDGDTLIEYLNPHSDVFFANVPSADLLQSKAEL